MEEQFNRKHGARQRSFDLQDAVFARHRSTQEWRPGRISNRRGVIYEVAFEDGHQVGFTRTSSCEIPDLAVDDTLDVFNDTFGLPLPPLVPPPAEVLPPLEVPEIAERTPSPPRRRYPERTRRPPVRLDL